MHAYFNLIMQGERDIDAQWGVSMVKWLKCWTVTFEISEFELQSCYYIHFQISTLEKSMNNPISPAVG